MKFGEIDATQILENEYRIMVLEKLVERLTSRIQAQGGIPITQQEMNEIRNSVIQRLQKKYPNSGITLKGPKSGG